MPGPVPSAEGIPIAASLIGSFDLRRRSFVPNSRVGGGRVFWGRFTQDVDVDSEFAGSLRNSGGRYEAEALVSRSIDAHVARPAQAQTGEGTFIIAGQHGHVHDLGAVLKGWKVAVTATSTQIQTGPLATCPIQGTIIIMQRNSSGKVQRKTGKGNALTSTFQLSARFDGDAVLIIQAQNSAHFCLGIVGASITVPNTFQELDTQSLDTQNMTSDDGTVEGWMGNEVPEQSIPVKDDAITEDGRRLLLSINRR